MSSDEALAAVAEAFAGEDVDRMEQSLLELWRVGLDPIVAGLLTEFEVDLNTRRRLPTGPTALKQGRRHLAAALAYARRGRSGDDVATRMQTVFDRYHPDPRLVRGAVDLLINSPSRINVPLDQVLWSIIEQTADPASRRWMESVPDRPLRRPDYTEDGHPFIRCSFAPKFNRRLAGFADRSSGWTCTPLTPDQRSGLLALVRTKMGELGKPVIPGGDLFASLLEAVLATPRDDAPRRVYADKCLEFGDVDRGTFITLQLLDPARLDDKALAQLARLQKKHWRTWLGKAASVLRLPSVQFKRGFPDSATLSKGSAKAIELTRGAIGWRTMTELTVETKHEAWLLLLEKRSLANLRTLRGDVRRWLRMVAPLAGTRLWELDLRGVSEVGPPVKAPSEPYAFPRLRRLRVTTRDLNLVHGVQTLKPLRILTAEIDVARARSEVLKRRFLLAPLDVLAWLVDVRERVDNRVEVRFLENGTPLLEVHTKRKGEGWIYALAVSDDLDGLGEFLAAIAPEVVVRKRLKA